MGYTMAGRRHKGRISSTLENMIYSLIDAGYRPSKIAKDLGISRGTVYYYLHPDKYIEKLEYTRRYERIQRSSWRLEHSDWELEDG
jgi:predicted transcriptional regulator